MRSRCLTWLLGSCLVLLLCSRVRAQEEAEFKRTIGAAVREFTAGHYGEAHTLFMRAHALNPNARTWRGMGLASFELRHYLDAERELEAALADQRRALDPVQRREAEEVLQRTRDFVVVYELHLSPTDAEIYVDDERAQLVSGTLRLDAGHYTLAVRAPGYAEHKIVLEVEPGAREQLSIKLSSAPAQLTVTLPPAAISRDEAQHSDAQPAARPRRWLLWTGASGLGVGLSASVVAWWLYQDRRESGQALSASLPGDDADLQSDWEGARGPMLGLGVAGSLLSTGGTQLLMFAAPSGRLPWWIAGAAASAGAGLMAWGLVDVAQGGACAGADVRACVGESQQRERGALLLMASAPLLSIPVTKLIRDRREPKRDRATVQLSGAALNIHGRW